jgi:kumamolisin
MKSTRTVDPGGRGAAIRLGGSRAPLPPAAVRESLRQADTPLDLTLRLRARSSGLTRRVAAIHDGRLPPLSRAELAARFGAADAARRAVERWAAREGVEIVAFDPARRAVELRGSAVQLARLFHVELVRVRHGARSWLSHLGAVHLPAELADAVSGVLGFHQQPLAGRGALPLDRASRGGAARATGPVFTAPQIAALYGFPAGFDGRGQTVGVVALGGGYRRSDLDAYFRGLKLPHPRFTDVSIHGARNAPSGRTRQFDGEVTGDIETVGALVPGAHVVVYFAPNTERGFLAAVAHAVHDRRHRPAVISVSWGRDERHWTRRTLRLFDEVLAEAAAMGLTVCCSSGDDGAFAEPGDRTPGVCFPASSAHVLACGGTSLVGTRRGAIRERCWRDAQGASGGGVSVVIARPAWQVTPLTPRQAARRKGRCLPDVAANGDPASGYRVFVAGAWHVGAGTSAAAPVWAGLVARLNQMLGQRMGLLTPLLYRKLPQLVRTGALRPVRAQEGSTALARRGWNRHTGLGVPDGRKLAAAIRAASREP